MNTYNNEKGGGSDDRASSRVPATTGERALEKDLANDILRIVPIGPSAETAFHELAVKKRKGQLDEHHAQFIVVTGKELVSATAGEGHHLKELDPVAQASSGPDRFGQCHHKPVILNDEFMKHGSMQCLHRPRTSIMVGGMRFDIQFCVTTSAKEQLYLEERKAWLTAREAEVPDTRISAIPFDSDTYTKVSSIYVKIAEVRLRPLL